jgi:hypothetical protein
LKDFKSIKLSLTILRAYQQGWTKLRIATRYLDHKFGYLDQEDIEYVNETVDEHLQFGASLLKKPSVVYEQQFDLSYTQLQSIKKAIRTLRSMIKMKPENLFQTAVPIVKNT